MIGDLPVFFELYCIFLVSLNTKFLKKRLLLFPLNALFTFILFAPLFSFGQIDSSAYYFSYVAHGGYVENKMIDSVFVTARRDSIIDFSVVKYHNGRTNSFKLKKSGSKYYHFDDIIFDESLRAGDAFDFGDDFYGEIDSVVEIEMYDGVKRKHYFMNIWHSWDGKYKSYVWVEGIGELRLGLIYWESNGFVPIAAGALCAGDSLILWDESVFNWDYEIQEANGPEPSCDFSYLNSFLGVNGNNSGHNIDIRIVKNQIIIANGLKKNYDIFSIEGKRMKGGKVVSRINISELDSGVYILVLRNEQNAFFEKIFKP